MILAAALTFTGFLTARGINVESQRSWVAPEVNIYETPDGYVLEAEMPGVTKDGLEITLEGNTLTFVGHRHDEVVKGTLLYRESSSSLWRCVGCRRDSFWTGH